MIEEPIRKHMARFPDARYIQAECNTVDFSQQSVHCTKEEEVGRGGRALQVEVPYDQLVIAVGAEPATFNIPGVREHCMFIKEVDDGEACVACSKGVSVASYFQGV